MSDSWWQLPGPGRFVDRAARSLREGNCVILCTPAHCPDPIPALRRGLDSDWIESEIRIDEEPAGCSPTDVLFERFGASAPADQLRSTATLAECDDFAGRLLYVDGVDANAWPHWRAFLADYAQVCRGLSPLQRTLFCVRLTGAVALGAPERDVCLDVHRYDGVERIDATLYAWLLVHETKRPRLEKELAAASIAAVALWDTELAERLADQPIEQILHPEQVLEGLATERGWRELPVADDRMLWAIGAKCGFDEVGKLHSAALVALGRQADVERRIWSAQVGVLFPFVEESRQRIVAELASVLQIPFTTDRGETIEDLRDLEIGHIERQLGGLRHVAKERLLQIRWLKQVRNALSHLEIVPADVIRAPELARLANS